MRFLMLFLIALLSFGGISMLQKQPRPSPSEEARWFMPGYWGYEEGDTPRKPSPGAWLTRCLSGAGGRPESDAWLHFNQLGDTLQFSHNLSRIVRPEDRVDHPEWFPLVAGQRFIPRGAVLNWQPDLGSEAVIRHAGHYVGAELRKQKGTMRSSALGINDALIYGESPATLRWVSPPSYFRGKPNYSNLIFNFTNRVAEVVEKEGRLPPAADWHIGCLAYYWCEQVPEFPVHPRVVPFLCADRSQGYDSEFWKGEMALQEAWASKGPRRLGLYDYLDGYGFLIPRIHIRLLVENLKHARSHGFTDYYGESSPNWGLDGPQHWLVAQLLSHPEADARSLLDEYYRRYFGEAAEPMRAFFTRCEEIWMSQPGPADWMKYYRNESQAELFPSTECRSLRTLLDQAAKLASQEKTRKRIEMVDAALWRHGTPGSHLGGKEGPDPGIGVSRYSALDASRKTQRTGRG